MSAITLEEAQAQLPELLNRLTVDEEIVITRNGNPVARLLPPQLPKGVAIYGRGKGKVLRQVDDDEHLQDFAEYLP